jgi:type I restriction enzyme S subunit
MHRGFVAINTNTKSVRDFLSRELLRTDLGTEVGSINYVKGSPYSFVKTKALQSHTFLPIFSNESVESIHPASFINHNLKRWDIIISKDSNIGEVIILDKDYPNHMLSGALYKLPIEVNKLYLLAFLKHHFFRGQLDRIVPKGVTIRHAGTKFLDCKIPMPNKSAEAVINDVESLMALIINCETEIQAKHARIDELIKQELFNSQSEDVFHYTYPTIRDVCKTNRLDTGAYSEQFCRIDFAIKNYATGYHYLDPAKLKSGNTPLVRHIGNEKSLKYRWVTPTNCSDFGYILIDERIDTPTRNNINENAMLLINRTSRGGVGEYVGIATFYDIAEYGTGYHNQGIYRVVGYSDVDLIFMTCFMNCNMMRKYCSSICVGSKMKEIKLNQFLNIPFPNFAEDVKAQVVKLFIGDAAISDLNDLPNISKSLSDIGVYKLHVLLNKLKSELDNKLHMIINESD